MKKLVSETDEMTLVVIRALLLELAETYQSEDFAKGFSPNSMIHPNLYQSAGREIDKYLGLD